MVYTFVNVYCTTRVKNMQSSSTCTHVMSRDQQFIFHNEAQVRKHNATVNCRRCKLTPMDNEGTDIHSEYTNTFAGPEGGRGPGPSPRKS